MQTSTPIDPSGNWVMTAKDAHGASFQVSGLLQTVDTTNSVTPAPNVVMVNPTGTTTQADASCFPFRVALGNGNVNGTTFTGIFGLVSQSG